MRPCDHRAHVELAMSRGEGRAHAVRGHHAGAIPDMTITRLPLMPTEIVPGEITLWMPQPGRTRLVFVPRLGWLALVRGVPTPGRFRIPGPACTASSLDNPSAFTRQIW